jgi:beta-lactamase superfamily II metal-dependent hydrolase
MIFNVHFLPAKYGDSIWIEYGQPGDTNVILIDGGTGGTKKHIKALLEELPGDKRIELLVITHIDRDHIEGILSLLSENQLGFSVGTVWFNGWPHLPGNDKNEQFGAVQGERLTAAIVRHGLSWNEYFGGKAVVLEEDKKPLERTLPGGMKIVLLSPTRANLAALKVDWIKELTKANLNPLFAVAELQDDDIEGLGVSVPDVEALCAEPFQEDDAAANGSSIAFIASYGGRSALFAGDSFPGVVLESLNRLYDGPAPFDLVKLSHHASAHNTSPELIKKLDCKKFAILTNGSIYKHPARVTVARLIKLKGAGAELLFNYRTEYNKCWDIASLKEKYGYKAIYPEGEGMSVSLI